VRVFRRLRVVIVHTGKELVDVVMTRAEMPSRYAGTCARSFCAHGGDPRASVNQSSSAPLLSAAVVISSRCNLQPVLLWCWPPF
jgi:hypothetical protein